MRFEPISVAQRGQLARAMAAVQHHKPEVGKYAGRMNCPRCGSALNFTIFSNGISWGQCAASCGVKWNQ